ncbi:MAG TPA: TolC family protein [Candidatus Acidoferrales bacterium]|nr:TolC family protein [Candidatus Acidoferrales bacterium]
MAIPSGGAGQAQSPFLGSAPAGRATGTTLDLSLKDAIALALRYNLGGIESEQNTRAARAARLRGLNALLPNLSAGLAASENQINLRAQGFNPSIPGVAIPTLVGPFSVNDARAYLSGEILNWSDLKNWKAATETERASQDSYKSDRNLVVFTAGEAYLLVISDGATVDSVRAQVKTSQTLLENDLDLHEHGLIANIDLLRARVEYQTQQQRLIAAENQLAIDKLGLARVIGLPSGQDYRLADAAPYAPLAAITLSQALEQAYATRPDYLAATASVRAAELSLEGAAAENYPSLSTAANYGDIGSPSFGSSHGTFSAGVTLSIPIFQGTRVRAAKLQADAVLEQRRAELGDLGGRIDQQVRTAFFNLKSSSELVTVARSNIDLANQTLSQARDRFRAGVADNLEVVQAQESVATANQSYIASLYSFNLAKLSLSLAMGVAEESALQYLGMR